MPHYNHLEQFRRFLPSLLAAGLPVFLVDDGSSEAQRLGLRELLEHGTGDGSIHALFHDGNRGKGAAIITAMRAARKEGHTHLLQIDADGQHDASQIPALLEESRRYPSAVICGAPVFDETAPGARRYGRKVTDFFVALETLSLGIRDSLCGFRVYPLAEFEQVLARYSIASGMGFDTDMIVKSSWERIELRFLDVSVHYPDHGESHFRYLGDNLRLVLLHTRLLATAILSLPRRLLWRRS